MPDAAPEQHYDLSVADAAVVQELAKAGPDQRIILLRRYLAAFGPSSLINLFAQAIGLANSVVANNREMIELAGIINGTLHPHTSHQINLPTISGAANGVALAAQAAGFRSDEGLPYDEGAVLKSAWRTMCKRAGLGPDVTPYTLRHTFCTWHYALHKDLLMLRDEMCWSTVELAERYAKLGPPGLADEVRAFWDRRHIIDTRPWHGTTISSELKAVS